MAFFFLLILFGLMIPTNSEAMPVFARKYNMSCVTCHAAFPRLNEFGKQFVSDNYRLPNWKDSTVNAGDEMLALPDSVPLAMRMQAFVQAREAETVDIDNGDTISADTDFQSGDFIGFQVLNDVFHTFLTTGGTRTSQSQFT